MEKSLPSSTGKSIIALPLEKSLNPSDTFANATNAISKITIAKLTQVLKTQILVKKSNISL